MKVLLVNTYYYPNMIGGTEHSVKLLAEGLSKKGHDVYVLTCDKHKDGDSIEVINGVNVIRLDLAYKSQSIAWKAFRKVIQLRNFYILSKINNILDEIKPDVVHTNNLIYLSTIIWKSAFDRNIKVVHTLRDYWGICRKNTLLKKDGAICDQCELFCKLHSANYKLLTKYVHTVTAASNFTLDLHVNRYYMFQDSKKRVVYNAIDFNNEEHLKILDEKANRESGLVEFLFMGSLDYHKGIKFAVEAFKEVKNPNIRLNICGDGPLKQYVEESAYKDKRIKYLGKVFDEEKEKILNRSDVMIVPSIWYEPFGRVVIEAYKYAMPVIGTNIGGIPELLTDNTSIKIQINNSKQLINAIEKFSSRNYIRASIKGISNNLSKYDLENQIIKFESIYADN
ncbi:glycosyltransferase family 4 protein [Clostridium sp. 19966]|uniref:glycosyltransferase family 4 protein n=1 Tax=Clostridium sp. 19966 TaxID=2768166 RepID=UPI0028DF3CB4|nr:glycosyltransferase family 4 protein [Clostridium sp. 19966]MDT8716129.1 glycosyltransferase family 4 protein [Clostridium sp. 19966]